MLKVALTGSIAMGKSTTAKMFTDLGCPVFDADAAVHALYARNGSGVAIVADLFPGVVAGGEIDREKLSAVVLRDPAALRRLEKAVHPLVRAQQVKFIDTADKAGHKFVVLDIPLLFETGGDQNVDLIVVVSAPADVQRARALERPGMTEEKLADILQRQLPDADKRARADFVVDTSRGLEVAFDQVRRIVEDLQARTSTG
ncbi:MAG: dephospho-CoA kinase [Rhizobiales bacterium]|nr:dephospho-CoA kinase [Hyphomicrobiales bacterium]